MEGGQGQESQTGRGERRWKCKESLTGFDNFEENPTEYRLVWFYMLLLILNKYFNVNSDRKCQMSGEKRGSLSYANSKNITLSHKTWN